MGIKNAVVRSAQSLSQIQKQIFNMLEPHVERYHLPFLGCEPIRHLAVHIREARFQRVHAGVEVGRRC